MERDSGNEIIYDTNRLQYASSTTKQLLMNMVDRGIIPPNKMLEAFNMPGYEGGDERVIRGEYIKLSDIQNRNEKTF